METEKPLEIVVDDILSRLCDEFRYRGLRLKLGRGVHRRILREDPKGDQRWKFVRLNVGTTDINMFKFIENFFKLNEAEAEIINTIKASKIKSIRVVGRGTIVIDSSEIVETEKYKELSNRAKRLLNKNLKD